LYYIYTAFDKTKYRPLASLIHNGSTGATDFYSLYLPGSGKTLREAKEEKKHIVGLFESSEVMVNDFRSHLKAFDLPLRMGYRVYDSPESDVQYPREKVALQKKLAQGLIQLRSYSKETKWRALAANASIVYEILERRGVLYEGMKVHPEYEICTYSGRSKTSKFNIQGTGDGQDIMPIQDNYNLFICADWISADIRMAAVISGDKELNLAFQESDPYSYAAKQLGLTREECKNGPNGLLPNVYALNTKAPILDLYPDFKQWIKNSAAKMHEQRELSSILGRRFKIDTDNHRQVFNAAIQGSVAHAMQNVLVRLYQTLPDYLLTELHDSVILCCRPDMAQTVVNEVTRIMLHPFRGMLESDPVFPLRISIGNHWRKWRELRECRS
jgi:hypothetical protein